MSNEIFMDYEYPFYRKLFRDTQYRCRPKISLHLVQWYIMFDVSPLLTSLFFIIIIIIIVHTILDLRNLLLDCTYTA